MNKHVEHGIVAVVSPDGQIRLVLRSDKGAGYDILAVESLRLVATYQYKHQALRVAHEQRD